MTNGESAGLVLDFHLVHICDPEENPDGQVILSVFQGEGNLKQFLDESVTSLMNLKALFAAGRRLTCLPFHPLPDLKVLNSLLTLPKRSEPLWR